MEVFAIPTSEILSLGRGPMKYAWQSESRHVDDEGGEEVAKWLFLLSKGSPHSIDMLFAPIEADWAAQCDPETLSRAHVMRGIGMDALSRKPVQEGVIGYAMNSFRKIKERPGKWKGAMLRVLYQGQELVYSGTLSNGLAVPEDGWGNTVRRALRDEMTEGEALDIANRLIAEIRAAPSVLPDEPDWNGINGWLLDLRRELW